MTLYGWLGVALGVWVTYCLLAPTPLGRAATKRLRPRRPTEPDRPAARFTPLTREQLAEIDAYDWAAAERDLTDH